MARRLLVDDVLDGLRGRIVDGEFPVDAALPGELDLVRQYEVSRVTVREAIKVLHAQGLVRTERGRGTFVNPTRRWTSLPAVIASLSARGDPAKVSLDLIEMRRIFEGGAAELAAEHADPEALRELDHQLEQMEAAAEESDVDAFVRADIAFHSVILTASGNAFIPVLMEPLSSVLRAGRTETSVVPEIQRHAIDHHRRVQEAVASGNGPAARAAMVAHMQQTANDLQHYVVERHSVVKKHSAVEKHSVVEKHDVTDSHDGG